MPELLATPGRATAGAVVDWPIEANDTTTPARPTAGGGAVVGGVVGGPAGGATASEGAGEAVAGAATPERGGGITHFVPSARW